MAVGFLYCMVDEHALCVNRFFWLPFFLSLHFTPGQSNMISILYDVGMMPGMCLLLL